MYKRVKVCDICQERVAHYKCEVCGKDICNNCLQVVAINEGYSPITFKSPPSSFKEKDFGIVCKSCATTIRLKLNRIENKKDLIKDIIEVIENHYKLYKL